MAEICSEAKSILILCAIGNLNEFYFLIVSFFLFSFCLKDKSGFTMHLITSLIIGSTVFDYANSDFGMFLGEARVYAIIGEFLENKTIAFLRLGSATSDGFCTI